MGSHSQQNDTAMQRNWPFCLQRQQRSESWNLEAKKRENTIHFSGDSVNSELLFPTVCSVNQSAQRLRSRNGMVSIRFVR